MKAALGTIVGTLILAASKKLGSRSFTIHRTLSIMTPSIFTVFSVSTEDDHRKVCEVMDTLADETMLLTIPSSLIDKVETIAVSFGKNDDYDEGDDWMEQPYLWLGIEINLKPNVFLNIESNMIERQELSHIINTLLNFIFKEVPLKLREYIGTYSVDIELEWCSNDIAENLTVDDYYPDDELNVFDLLENDSTVTIPNDYFTAFQFGGEIIYLKKNDIIIDKDGNLLKEYEVLGQEQVRLK